MRVSLVGLLTSLASCSLDLAVPPDAVISCADTSPCPDGFHCTVGRCVSDNPTDRAAPLVQSAQISETVLRRDSVATLTLQVSEPLLAAPSASLLVRGDARPLVPLGSELGAAPRYRFSYATRGDEPEGEPLAITVALIDAAGNLASPTLDVVLSFDFTPPALAADSVSASLVPGPDNQRRQVSALTLESTFSLSATASEPLRSAELLGSADGTVAFGIPCAADGATVRCAYTLGPDAPSDGAYELAVVLEDELPSATCAAHCRGGRLRVALP